MGWLGNLWRGLVEPAPSSIDGYGQSLIDDIRSEQRFRALRRQAIRWHPLSDWHGDIDADFPILARFGDPLCWHSDEGEDRIIIDRVWHGWPDPPEYAIFAFDGRRQIVWATDFDRWPEAWEQNAPRP